MATWLDDDHIRVFTFFLVTVAVIRTTVARVPESFILVGAVCTLHHSLSRRGIVIQAEQGQLALDVPPGILCMVLIHL